MKVKNTKPLKIKHILGTQNLMENYILNPLNSLMNDQKNFSFINVTT